MKSQESGNESAESVNAERDTSHSSTVILKDSSESGDFVLRSAVIAARNFERERCAKIAEVYSCVHIATLIRAITQRDSGSEITTEGATAPSQPSPESTEADELWTRLADALEFIRNDKAYANAQGIIAALRVKSLTPVSESLTPDVQGKLIEALVKCAIPYEALLLDAPSRKWIAPEVWNDIEQAVIAIREALALLPENQDQKIK